MGICTVDLSARSLAGVEPRQVKDVCGHVKWFVVVPEPLYRLLSCGAWRSVMVKMS